MDVDLRRLIEIGWQIYWEHHKSNPMQKSVDCTDVFQRGFLGCPILSMNASLYERFTNLVDLIKENSLRQTTV